MDFQEFSEKILEMLQEKLSDKQRTEICSITKNNGIKMRGITIRTKDRNTSSTICLDDCYELYMDQMPLNMIVERIWNAYERSLPKEKIDMRFFLNYDLVKERVIYKLINFKKNKELLSNIPYIPFWDLAIVFCYAFYSEELGDALIQINNNHLAHWGLQVNDLARDAEANTPRLFPYTFQDVNIVMKRLMPDINLAEPNDGSMYMLTNNIEKYGASTILYPNVLSRIAEELKGSYYIIPSSTHECLILPTHYDESELGQELCHVIPQVNTTSLVPEEVLSDYPFFYDYPKKQLIQLT